MSALCYLDISNLFEPPWLDGGLVCNAALNKHQNNFTVYSSSLIEVLALQIQSLLGFKHNQWLRKVKARVANEKSDEIENLSHLFWVAACAEMPSDCVATCLPPNATCLSNLMVLSSF